MSEVFEAIKAELGISKKIVLRLRTMRHAPIESAHCFILWYRAVKLAGDREYNRGYYLRNKARYKEQSRESYIRNREKVLRKTKERQSSPDGIISRRIAVRRWREKNPEKRAAYEKKRKESGAAKAYHQKYREKNQAKENAKVRRWRKRKLEQDPDFERRSLKAYRAQNPDKVRQWKRDYEKRNADNPIFIVVKRLRTRLLDELRFRGRRTVKHCSALKLVGCTRQELAFWIESQFKKGMSWKNRSAWHIDHIVPVASFDMTNLEEQKRCFHYTNLRPLWKTENLRKSDKIIPFKPVHLEMFPELKHKAKA
jgi:hypothetical protein